MPWPCRSACCAIVNKMAMRDLEQRLEARQAGVSGLQYAVLGHLRRESTTLSDLSRKLSGAGHCWCPSWMPWRQRASWSAAGIRWIGAGYRSTSRWQARPRWTACRWWMATTLWCAASPPWGSVRACQLFDLLHELAKRMSGGRLHTKLLEPALDGE